MSTQRIVGIALLAVGLGLLFFGYQATGSISEDVHEAVTGRYSDQTTWYLVGGGASAVAGLLLVFSGRRR